MVKKDYDKYTITFDRKVLNETSDGKVTISMKDLEKALPDDYLLDCTRKELQGIIDCIHDGIYITDGEGYTLMYNKADMKFAEGSSAENDAFVGRKVSDLLAEGAWSMTVTGKVLESGREESHIQHTMHYDLLTTGTPLYENDKIKRVVCTDRSVNDILALEGKVKEAETKLEKLQARQNYRDMLRQMSMNTLLVASRKMTDLLEIIYKVGPTDVPVLIEGESGCGKELLSDYLVEHSDRKDKPFLKINCGAIPKNLIEAELFGYEKGAFTGADTKGKIGLFEAAEGGTILLDEIGNLPIAMQPKLLRVLQEKQFMRVGGNEPVSVDVRIIAATNLNLKEEVGKGLFRQDLFYRLNVITLEVPPLRERREDIVPLVNHFVEEFCKKYHRNLRLTQNAMYAFEQYDWPGNVRELKNLLERIVLVTEKDVIEEDDVLRFINMDAVEQYRLDTEASLKEQVEDYERQLLVHALAKAGNASKAAELLQINKSTISKKMRKYDILPFGNHTDKSNS